MCVFMLLCLCWVSVCVRERERAVIWYIWYDMIVCHLFQNVILLLYIMYIYLSILHNSETRSVTALTLLHRLRACFCGKGRRVRLRSVAAGDEKRMRRRRRTSVYHFWYHNLVKRSWKAYFWHWHWCATRTSALYAYICDIWSLLL